MANKSPKTANGDPKLQSWQHEPPYVREEPENRREALYRGHCHCKKVKYELYDEPKVSSVADQQVLTHSDQRSSRGGLATEQALRFPALCAARKNQVLPLPWVPEDARQPLSVVCRVLKDRRALH